MRIRALLFLSCASFLSACGNNASTTNTPQPAPASAIQSISGIPYFEPAEFKSPPPQQPLHTIPNNRVYLATKDYYAQSFTSTNDGFLTALQLDLVNQGSSGDFIIEIFKLKELADPPSSQDSPLGQIVTHGDSIPRRFTGVSDQPKLVTFDLTPLRIRCSKDDVFSIRTRFTDDGNFALSGVMDADFKGGYFFSKGIFGDVAHQPWYPGQNNLLAFRVYTQNTLPDAPAQSTIPGKPSLDDTPPGDLMIECLWKPQPPSFGHIPPAPKIAPFDCSGTAFHSNDHYYIQLIVFNPTNQPRYTQTTPTSITLIPKAGGEGTIIETAHTGFAGPMKQLDPNEGQVRTFQLSDTDIKALTPGDYRVSIVLPRELGNKSIESQIAIVP